MKINHIDSKRMELFIEHSKGRKDRVVPLSSTVLQLLRSLLQGISTERFFV